jgi:hypothetical protein
MNATTDVNTRITDKGNMITVSTRFGKTTYTIEQRPLMWIARPTMIRNERIGKDSTPTYADTRDELIGYIISTAEYDPSQTRKLNIAFKL